MAEVETTITVKVGCAVRNEVREELRQTARNAGLDIKIEEKWRMLQSVMRVDVSGDEEGVATYLRDIRKYGQQRGFKIRG